MAGAIGHEKLDVRGGISFDLIFQPVDMGFPLADPLLVDRGSPYGMVERKRPGVFHQLIKIIPAGDGHVAEVYPGVELWKPDVHPAGFGVCRPIRFHRCISRDTGGKWAPGSESLIGFFRKFDAEISTGLG